MELRVRVARNVDGMDVALYDEVLKLRRQFEAERAGLMGMSS